MQVPGYDDQLLSDLGDENVSIEHRWPSGTGWCTSPTPAGWSRMGHQRHPERRNEVRAGIRFWDGDETDASIVIDEEGFLYVGRHASFNVRSRPQKRGHQVGSLMKLDPD